MNSRTCRTAGVVIASVVVNAFVIACKPVPQANQSSNAMTSGDASERAAEARERMQQENPNALVGVVIETLPEANLAAVAQVPVGEFKPSDAVTFVDRSSNPIDTGIVRATTADNVHVRYDNPPMKGGRIPQKGDLMVRVKPR